MRYLDDSICYNPYQNDYKSVFLPIKTRQESNTKFSEEDLRKVENNLHQLLEDATKDEHIARYRPEWAKANNGIDLPIISNEMLSETKPRWFTIPGMYGGFAYALFDEDGEPTIRTESWCRIVGGSGQAHEITTTTIKLIAKGFI